MIFQDRGRPQGDGHKTAISLFPRIKSFGRHLDVIQTSSRQTSRATRLDDNAAAWLTTSSSTFDDKFTDKPDDKSIDKSDDKSDFKSDDKSDDKSNGKSDDKPNDKADDKSNDKSNDKSDDMHPIQSRNNKGNYKRGGAALLRL